MPAKRLGKHRAFELYSLAKPRAQKKDRDPDEIEYEKFCDECTFAQISRQQKTGMFSQDQPESTLKTLVKPSIDSEEEG